MIRNQMKTPPHNYVTVQTVHCNTALISAHKNTNIQYECNIEFSLNYYIIIIS